MADSPAIANARSWIRLVAALVGVFALFHGLASWLGSLRGEAGLWIGAAVVAAVIAVDRMLLGSAVAASTLGPPARRGVIAVVVVSVILLAVFPLLAWLGGGRLVLDDHWLALVPGLFAQAGIAEELLFRGFLFAHLRRGRSFWRASVLSMLPFVAVHLFLFVTLPFPIAAASVGLSVVMSFPFAQAFELCGRTIWGAALLHFIVQGAIKVIALDGPLGPQLPMIWMAAAAVVPFGLFVFRRS